MFISRNHDPTQRPTPTQGSPHRTTREGGFRLDARLAFSRKTKHRPPQNKIEAKYKYSPWLIWCIQYVVRLKKKNTINIQKSNDTGRNSVARPHLLHHSPHLSPQHRLKNAYFRANPSSGRPKFLTPMWRRVCPMYINLEGIITHIAHRSSESTFPFHDLDISGQIDVFLICMIYIAHVAAWEPLICMI